MDIAAAGGSSLVVGLGEALFDRIEGRCFLGGAPVNFAVHAHQLLAPIGGAAVVASRVGDDALGHRLLDELANRGLDNAWVQRDAESPTGVVEVAVDANGHPVYTICGGVAWDRFESTPSWAELASRCSAVCFGTLAQRSPASRAAILAFLERSRQAERVCDLNLRQHYYDRGVVAASLELATVLKLNEEELQVVGALLEAPASCRESADDAVAWLADRHRLAWVALTRGERGTVLYGPGGRYEEPPRPAVRRPDADSVGAGDACCAALVAGLLQRLSPERILELANAAGAFVASQRGATPRLPAKLAAEFAG